MVALMEVSRVGAEVEVEKMTADTHVATETALTRSAAETAISTEEVVVRAHALGAQIGIIVLEAIAVIEMTQRYPGPGRTDETDDEQVKAQNGRLHLL